MSKKSNLIPKGTITVDMSKVINQGKKVSPGNGTMTSTPPQEVLTVNMEKIIDGNDGKK